MKFLASYSVEAVEMIAIHLELHADQPHVIYLDLVEYNMRLIGRQIDKYTQIDIQTNLIVYS